MRTHIRYLLIAAIIFSLSILLLPGSSAQRKGIKPTTIEGSSSVNGLVRFGRLHMVGLTALEDETADLGVVKSASDTVTAGSNLTYTIEVHNDGPLSADNATLSDDLPAGTTFVSLSYPAGWMCSTPSVGANGNVSCTNPSLPVTSGEVFTLVVNVPSATPPGMFINNVAVVSTSTLDPNDENNSSPAGTLVVGSSADLGVLKTASPDTVRADSDLTYTIEVHNGGPNNADNVTWTDALQGNLTFVSLVQTSGPSFNCSNPPVGSGGTVTCTNASLPANSVAVFTLVAHVPSGTSPGTTYTNTATVTSDTPDPNDENNTSTVTTTVVACITNPGVTSNADDGPGSLRRAILDACPGNTITFAPGLVGPITLTSGELLIDKNLTIQGPGANVLTVRRDGNAGEFRIFHISNGNNNVTIDGLTISNGKVNGPPDLGGAIFNESTGVVNVIRSTLSDNSASSGGGIFNLGNLTVSNSTFTGNSAVTGAGGGIDSEGGTLSVINSTISGNSADTGGGGLFNGGNSTATLINVTITNNRADADGNSTGAGGGIGQASSNTITLNNTLVAGNFKGTSPGTTDDISGTMDPSSSFNLIGTGGSGGLTDRSTDPTHGNQVGVANPGLGPLANNGGPTQTHALLQGSPALDAGSNTLLPQDPFDLDFDGVTGEPLPVDQRGPGFLRVTDSADADTTQTVDIGAYEAQVSVEDITDKTTPEDTPLSFSFNVGDAGIITSVTALSSNPTLVPNNAANLSVTGTGSTRTLQINPAANLSGTTTITVTVSGNNSQTATDTFVLNVTPVNDAPVADSQSVTTNEDTPKAITLTGSDVDSSSLSYIIVSGPSHGMLSGSGPNVTYTPAANYNGPDSFTFKINDGSADSNVATVSITVNAVNDAPQAFNDSYSTNENTTLNVPAPGVLTNDTDVEGATLTAAIASNPSHGAVTLNSNGSFTYTPQTGFSGTDSFTYKANDGQLDSNSATVTITVNEGGAFVFSSASYSVNESGGSVTITINRTGGSAGTATVLFSTSNGTASAADYTSVSQTLTFNDGETSKTVNIPITNDALNEANETINLTLSNAGGTGQLGTPSTAVLTIVDDDPQQSALSINDVTQAEGNSGTTSFTFTVTLSAVSGQQVTVNYATANGTATAPSDYQAASGTLIFNEGQTTKTITVLVNGDTLAEPDETFFVNLSGATNASISDNQGVGTILSEDAPVVQFSASTYTVAEDGSHAIIIVNRLGDISQPASVQYATSDPAGLTPCSEAHGIASQRCDYATVVGILNFAAGETSKTIFIPIVNDSYAEGPETFQIALVNPSGGELGVPSTATVTINDNDAFTGPNPIVTNEFFIRQLYIDFLGREPDPPGYQGWLNTLNNCPSGDSSCDRLTVASGFVRSEEFAIRGYFIYKLYRAVLGRIPTYTEFTFDMARVSGFLTAQELEAAKVAFILDFMSRTEFRSKYDPTLNDPSGYVNLLEQTALVTLPNKQQLIDDLAAGRKTRAQVLREVIETAVVNAKFYNEAFIVMNYFGFLRRDPDAAYQDWIDRFNHSNDDRMIINGFANSPEYRVRFGP